MANVVSTENKPDSGSLPMILAPIFETAYLGNPDNLYDLYHKKDLGDPIVLKERKPSFDENLEERLKILVQEFALQFGITNPGFTYTIDSSEVVINLYSMVRH